MEYNDMDERNRQWDVLVAGSPEWLEVKQKSEADGPIVKQVEKIFMQDRSFLNESIIIQCGIYDVCSPFCTCKLGRPEEARSAYSRAIGLCEYLSIRQFLY